MPVMQAVLQGWLLIKKQWKPLIIMMLVFDLPVVLGETVSILTGVMTDETATAVWGLLALVIMPIASATGLLLFHAASQGEFIALHDAVRGGFRAWSRYQVAFLYASFYVAGWIILCTIPGIAILMAVGQKQVWPIAPFVLAGGIRGFLPLTFLGPYLVIEGLEPWQARMNSRTLAKGRWRSILALGFATLPLPMALEFGGTYGLKWLDLEQGWQFGSLQGVFGMASGCLYLVSSAAFYVLYRELVGQSSARGSKPSDDSAVITSVSQKSPG